MAKLIICSRSKTPTTLTKNDRKILNKTLKELNLKLKVSK